MPEVNDADTDYSVPVGRSRRKPGVLTRAPRFHVRVVAGASGSSISASRKRCCSPPITIGNRRVNRRFGSPSHLRTCASRQALWIGPRQ